MCYYIGHYRNTPCKIARLHLVILLDLLDSSKYLPYSIEFDRDGPKPAPGASLSTKWMVYDSTPMLWQARNAIPNLVPSGFGYE